ncbi:MAG: S8 family serine peptidase [Acidobacteriota bacterium]|nr:S8 family serine peptidase [Acidobacteriota bacterium]
MPFFCLLVFFAGLALPTRAAERRRQGPAGYQPPATRQRPIRERPAAPASVNAPPGAAIFPADEPARRQLERLAALRDWILFDGARFDPLLHGPPDLSAFVPVPPGSRSLPATAPRLAVVQFEQAPGPAQRARILAAGAEILSYVPHQAYLVRADAYALATLAGSAGVRWVGRYEPGFKVDRRLGRLARGLALQRPLPGERAESLRLDLLFAPGVDLAGARAAVGRALPGVEVLQGAESSGVTALTLELPLRRLAFDLGALAALEEVVVVEPAGMVDLHNDDAVWIGQSYDVFARQNYSASATIWKHGLLGAGEIIAIADTGVDPDVCWMEDAAGLPPVSSIPAFGASRGPLPVDDTRRKIIAYNLLGSLQDSATAYDVRSGDPHGTWVAIAAVGDNPDNPADENDPVGPHHDASDGMAPLAKLVVEDLGNDSGTLVGLGLPVPRVLDRMFEQEYEAGARISTNSWGSAGNQYDLLSFFTDRMVWNHPDFLIVFSAGNRGPYAGSLDSPGTAKNVVTVGASEARLSPSEDLDPDNLAEFSSRGPTEDGRLKPDLVISGKQLITGDSDLGETGRTCTTREVSGTSFAAPLTAGFAALAREYFRKGFYPTGTENAADGFIPSAALLKAVLIAGALNMTGRGGPDYGPCNIDTCDTLVGLCSNTFTTCQDDEECSLCAGNQGLQCRDDRDCDLSLVQDDAPTTDQGWGRLMLDDALYFDGDSRGLALWDVPRNAGLSTGETWSAEFYVDSTSSDLKVVLTWPDPPSLVASPTFLVNDLDLRLTAPDGTVYWGNAWNPRDRSPFTIEYTQPGVRPLNDPDNVEMVRLAGYTLTPGLWKVEVVGESVPGSGWADLSSRQDFAVVATGPVSTSGGTVSFDKQRYPCSGDVVIEVLDGNRTIAPTVDVTTGSGDAETLTLVDAGGGRFTGSLPLAANTALATSDGILQVADSETLTVTYDDDDPLLSATAKASVACSGSVQIAAATISGGCDNDGYLDAGESVDLALTLVNPGRTDLPGVQARLVSSLGDVFIEQDTSTFGTIPAGGSAAGVAAYRLSLRDGAAPRDTRGLELVVTTSDSSVQRRVPLPLTVEADEQRTQATWSEDFTSATLLCHDGSSDAPLDSWYYFDLDQNCSTSEETWQFSFCFGEPMALFPSCNGTWLSTSNEKHHRLVSPQVDTGPAGSRTVLQRVRFLEDYHLLINEDGKLCDRTVVDIFTNRDGRLISSGYYRNQSADGNDHQVDLDLSEIAEFELPPVPDATLFQLIFHAASNDTETGASSCGGSSGDEYRWRVDNVEVDYENIQIVDDATAACAPGCTPPDTPQALTATRLDTGGVLVAWDPVGGADHYDVYRVTGGARVLAGRVQAPDAALVDLPEDPATDTWEVEAVSASGLCASAAASTGLTGPAPDCRLAPSAPASLVATDGAGATCSLQLDWAAATSPCSHPVEYAVYRSTEENFVTGPGNLLARTAATSLVDDALLSGWDDQGQPTGQVYHYAVRAVDTVTQVEGDAVRGRFRAGGPRQLGTWLDDAGDTVPAKMTSTVSVDENDAGAGWSRSPVAVRHGGDWSYWTDDESLGDGRYPPLSCFSLVSPDVALDGSGGSELHLWVDYDIEYQWDGLVIEIAVDGGAFTPIDPIGGYPSTFAQTVAPPCAGAGGGSGSWINGCDYPPSQGAITGPDVDGLSGWQEFVFDLSAWAGSELRFRARMSTDCGTDGGAVLDDLSITAALLPTSCQAGGCYPAPSFAGLLEAKDPDPQTAGAIELSWGAVESWGGGGPGEFVIYRDGEEIARVAADQTSYTDLQAEANRPHLYQVVARSGSGCDLPGPAPSRIEVTDCGDLEGAVQTAARLEVLQGVSTTNLVLRSTPIGGAARYRFLHSGDPATVAGSTTFLEAPAPEARHGVRSDGLNYFYLVEGHPSPACP